MAENNALMTKRLLTTILLMMVFMAGMPAMAGVARNIEIIENPVQAPVVLLVGNTLRVTNASGEMLYVYNVAGVRVMATRVEGGDKTFELNLPRGCYIVKIGNTVRKISLK